MKACDKAKQSKQSWSTVESTTKTDKIPVKAKGNAIQKEIPKTNL